MNTMRSVVLSRASAWTGHRVLSCASLGSTHHETNRFLMTLAPVLTPKRLLAGDRKSAYRSTRHGCPVATEAASSTLVANALHRRLSQSADTRHLYTASDAFFEALCEAGVTHCFVNLGSDHPSIIEAMVKGKRSLGDRFPRIITCPNEMVAMSMADGYARLTGQPQCVIVHVDVGTQGLAAAVHNSSTGRAPVFVFAGMSPFTQEGELRGSRTEFIHWIQDVHDQKQIVGQYCRYTAEVRTGRNIKQMVRRALQFASSDPQGPVYLCAAREVLEAEMEPYAVRSDMWKPVRLGALPAEDVDEISAALATAKAPLVVVGYSGRNHQVPGALVELADTVKALRVLDSGGSDVCFPANHPSWRGLRYGSDDCIRGADVIVVFDCDVPWIPTQCAPRPDARIFHIDLDPLKEQMCVFYIDAEARYRADALTAIRQITTRLRLADMAIQLEGDEAQKQVTDEAQKQVAKVASEYRTRMAAIDKISEPLPDGRFGVGYLCRVLREMCPEDTIWAVEAVTNTVLAHDSLRPSLPGQWINCGGGGLGWSGGGALGIKLATDYQNGGAGKGKFVVQIVGDGSFLFSVPGSVYWVSKKYEIPLLTIVLNNKGWHAPRRSLLLVHPDGHGAHASNEDINIAIDPSPDFGGIARAAAGNDLFAAKVDQTEELAEVLRQAIESVKGGRTAVVDCGIVAGH